MQYYTARPLLSGHLLSGHLPPSSHFPKLFISKVLYPIPLFSGHLFDFASLVFDVFLPLLSSQQIIFSSEMVTKYEVITYKEKNCNLISTIVASHKPQYT